MLIRLALAGALALASLSVASLRFAFPPVQVLLALCRPSAVLWRIWTVIIDAIDRMLRRRPFSHISEKVLKIVPFLAYGNASSSPAFKSLYFRVVAPLKHLPPNVVFRCATSAVNNIRMAYQATVFLIKATAGLCIAAANGCSNNSFFSTAIASKLPVRIVMFVSANKLYRSQTVDPFPGNYLLSWRFCHAAMVSLMISCISYSGAFSMDNGQYKDVPPNIRNWFKSVRSPQGIPCCDIADGRRTVWRPAPIPPGGYEVFVDGEWLPVPPEAIVLGANNPTGDSIVWLRPDKVVRCFVLAPEG